MEGENLRNNPLFGPQPQDVRQPPPQVGGPPQQRARVNGPWNNYGLDPNHADVTGAIVVPPLPPGSKFPISSGLLQMLQNRGLFSGKATEDPIAHLANVTFICKSILPDENLSMDAVGLRVFPLSLTGEATSWLAELPYNSIATWAQMQEVFLERYFPRSKKLELKDHINNFQQHPGEAISAAWERFTKCLRQVPNHRIDGESLMEIFYMALDDNTKAVVDTIMGGSFMDYAFEDAAQR